MTGMKETCDDEHGVLHATDTSLSSTSETNNTPRVNKLNLNKIRKEAARKIFLKKTPL